VPQVTVFYLGLGSLVLVSRSLVAGGCSPPPARHSPLLQADRLLDPKNDITVSSLQRAAAIVGRRVRIELV